jgi:quercetin dioxygenase-like cupin family protein
MKRYVISTALLIGGVAIGFSLPESIRAQAPGYATKQVFKTDLVNLPGQEVIIYASEWPPGYQLPLHEHEEGHEFVYVIEGEQTFEIDGVGTKVVKAGEVVYTPPNTKHFGRAATDKPSKNAGFSHQRQRQTGDDSGEVATWRSHHSSGARLFTPV